MRIGDIELLPLSDGTFVARPEYFAAHAVPDAINHPFGPDGVAWLPIGCFLLRTAGRIILVDAGLGPARTSLPHGMALVGGQLPVALRAAGVRPAQITDIICTHLHSDHVGWLFDHDAQPTFPEAAIWFGAGDWDHFVDGPGEMAAHIEHGFRTSAADLRALEHDRVIAPGIAVMSTPGHTPGHCTVIASSGQERVLLLGDAITCPFQLEDPAWHSFGDVDPARAHHTRERLWRELEDEHTVGAGAHFPELGFGRVLAGHRRTWSN